LKKYNKEETGQITANKLLKIYQKHLPLNLAKVFLKEVYGNIDSFIKLSQNSQLCEQ